LTIIIIGEVIEEADEFGTGVLSDGVHHVGGHEVVNAGSHTLFIGSGVGLLGDLSGFLSSELGLTLSSLSGFPSGEIFSVDTLLVVLTFDLSLFSSGGSLSLFLTFLGLFSLNDGLGFGAVSGEMSFLTAVVAWPGLSGGSFLTGSSLLLGSGAVSSEVTFLVAVSAGLSSGGTGRLVASGSLGSLLLGLGAISGEVTFLVAVAALVVSFFSGLAVSTSASATLTLLSGGTLLLGLGAVSSEVTFTVAVAAFTIILSGLTVSTSTSTGTTLSSLSGGTLLLGLGAVLGEVTFSLAVSAFTVIDSGGTLFSISTSTAASGGSSGSAFGTLSVVLEVSVTSSSTATSTSGLSLLSNGGVSGGIVIDSLGLDDDLSLGVNGLLGLGNGGDGEVHLLFFSTSEASEFVVETHSIFINYYL
jgi:hypothetical protein